jgi:23S rRNA (cytosine1962-C5)-methyltransferase
VNPNALKTYLNDEGIKHWRSGHPWLTANHLAKGVRLPKVPCALFLAGSWYLLSPASHLRLRRLGVHVDEGATVATADDFAKKFGDALTVQFANLLNLKRRFVEGENLFRWIFGDADGFPGLVVDVFEDTLVGEILSAPVEVFWPAIESCLKKAFMSERGQAPREVLAKRNHSIRLKEGLAVEPVERASQRRWLPWNSLQWHFDPGGAQKTGAYLDQRMNHLRAAHWARVFNIRHAHDICCFEGGFGMHLLKAGVSVTAVDTSQAALDVLRINADKNELQKSLTVRRQDAFEYLQELHKSGEWADMIVLDPPPFAPSQEQKDSALRGFYDLNKRAILCLRSNGLLVSCSCSHALGMTEMKKAFRRIALEIGRELRVLEIQGASPDHTRSLAFPEGDYLTAFFIAVT